MALSTKRPSRRGPPGSRESWNWGTEPPRGGAFPAGACRWPPPFRKMSGCSSQWFHPDPSFHSSRCLPVSPAVTSVTPSPDPLSGFNLGDPVGRPHSVCPAPAPSISASRRVLLHLAPCHPLSPLSLCGRKPGSLFGRHPFMANQVKEKCPPLFLFFSSLV